MEILLIIIVIVVFYLSFAIYAKIRTRNKEREKSESEIDSLRTNKSTFKNNSINFEKGVINTIKDFTINYRVEDTKENINNCLFSQNFLFKSEMKLKRFSDVMEAKITQRLEQNKFKLRLGETEKKYSETSSDYNTPFYNKDYTLFISISKTKTKKIYDVFIAFIKIKQETFEDKDDKQSLIEEINLYIKNSYLNFADKELKEDLFLYKIQAIEKKELDGYFKPFQDNGMIKEDINFMGKIQLHSSFTCQNLIKHLENKGYKINMINVEEKEKSVTFKFAVNEKYGLSFIGTNFLDGIALFIITCNDPK